MTSDCRPKLMIPLRYHRIKFSHPEKKSNSSRILLVFETLILIPTLTFTLYIKSLKSQYKNSHIFCESGEHGMVRTRSDEHCVKNKAMYTLMLRVCLRNRVTLIDFPLSVYTASALSCSTSRRKWVQV